MKTNVFNDLFKLKSNVSEDVIQWELIRLPLGNLKIVIRVSKHIQNLQDNVILSFSSTTFNILFVYFNCHIQISDPGSVANIKSCHMLEHLKYERWFCKENVANECPKTKSKVAAFELLTF